MITDKKKLKEKNRAWVSAYFGCALGAGILFIPVQAGQTGIYESIIIMLMAFVVMYLAQKYFTIILVRSKTNRGFDKAIATYIGKRWALIISILYVIIMFSAMIAYATAINNSIPEILIRYNLTKADLSRNPIFTLGLLIFLTILPLISEHFLLTVMARVSQVLIVLLIIMGIMFIPYWNLTMFCSLDLNWYSLLKDFLLCFPIFLYSAIYYPTISPMVTDYKTDFPEMTDEELEKNAILVTRKASSILSIFILLFTLSAVLSLTPHSLERAIQQNTSTLAVIGFGEENITVFLHSTRLIGFVTLIAALMTSYYGSVLGIVEVIKGFFQKKHSKYVENYTNIIMLVVLYIIVIFNFDVLSVIGMIETPIAGLIVFVLPVCLFFAIKQFKNYRSILAIIIGLCGFFVIFSFLVGKII